MVTQAWAVNKCKGPDGKVTYQEADCLNGNTRRETEESRGQAPSQKVMAPDEIARALDAQMKGAVLEEMERQAMDRERQLGDAKPIAPAARGDGKVSVGMQRDQVLDAWGKPGKVNETLMANGNSEQWIYYRGGSTTQYVHLRNGVVTSVHTSR